MVYMCYYTHDDVIYFTVMDSKGDTRGVVSGSDKKENLAQIIETYNVREIERID